MSMNRRGLFRGMLGLFGAGAAAKLPFEALPETVPACVPDVPVFIGGNWTSDTYNKGTDTFFYVTDWSSSDPDTTMTLKGVNHA